MVLNREQWVRVIAIMLIVLANYPKYSIAQYPAFDALMQSLLQRHNVPGGSLSVSKNGRMIYSKGFGFSDLANREHVDTRSLFRIGSVSKPIAAVAVLKLIEEGRLTLDTKVFEHLGKLKLPPRSHVNPAIFAITVRHLLNHTSGLAIYNHAGRINSPMQPPISREISQMFDVEHPPLFDYVVGYMATRPLLHPVGNEFKYSNFGYALLGLLVEKVTK